MERQYKDSGIEWIGKIPETWKSTKLFNLCTIKGRIGWNGLRSDEFKERSYAYLVTGQDFISSEISWDKCYQIDKERYDEDPFIQLSEGDILITKDGTIGKIAKVSNMDKPACLNSGIFVLKQRVNTFFQNYLYWYLVSPILLAYNSFINSGGTTIMHLYQNVFERFPLLVPPISEQHLIADYLDKKCGEIDSLIALQEQMIESLKAYKQSVITEAVTKGLDPNAKLVPSGIDWIGDIPEGWKIPKTLYTLNMPITDGPHTTPELFESGIPFVSAEAVSCGNGSIDFDHIRGFISQQFYEECCLKYIPQVGDVYMIKSGATTGKVSIVDTEKVFTIWSPLAVFRSNMNVIIPRFLFYTLQGDYYQKQISLYWTYGTQQNIGMRTLEQLLIVLPPLSEQQAIASYLDEKCADIDRLIAIKQQKIESLKNYKKSVIYEAVTGKTIIES